MAARKSSMVSLAIRTASGSMVDFVSTKSSGNGCSQGTSSNDGERLLAAGPSTVWTLRFLPLMESRQAFVAIR